MRLLTVLWIVVKQIVRNWRLELGLLLGLVMAVAIVSAVPIYTNGALQYSLMRDWVRSTTRGRLPYTLFLLHDPGMEGKVDTIKYQRLMDFLEKEVEERLDAPLLYYSRIGTVDTQGIRPVDPKLVKKEQYGNLRYMSGLKERVDVIEGRWPAPLPRDDGVLEVIVDEKALDSKELLVGRQYIMRLAATSDYDREMKTLTTEVVGVFRPKEETKGSPIWAYYPPFENSFFISEEFLTDHLMKMEGVAVYELVWYWVFDHESVYVDELPSLISELEHIENTANQILPGTRLWLSPLSTFRYFGEKAFYLRLLMFVLSVPILGMVLYFIVLAASLTVSRRQTEIAMLRSRGSSAGQILFSYLIEWCLLGIVAFVIGPWLGLFISKVIGASAGFLSFVDRTGLPVRLGHEAYRYALIGVVTAVLACLIPVVSATRHSIVTYKQEMVRKSRSPLWQRYYLDFLLA
ncbi:MAG: FtsX-like permease family protein, partial [Firmicutes bacterium]|nr:FtsX-like permease family protein [Bacillota bacterium]